MPSQQEFLAAARRDLVNAMWRHGGQYLVARRLGLTYTGPEYITPKTASEVERAARAIQPLAESNLLSGAQVMVILRRAGLLEFRNKRVARLNAGLARGDHDTIELAIAQLASGVEDLTIETVTGEASQNLTTEEVETLVVRPFSSLS